MVSEMLVHHGIEKMSNHDSSILAAQKQRKRDRKGPRTRIPKDNLDLFPLARFHLLKFPVSAAEDLGFNTLSL